MQIPNKKTKEKKSKERGKKQRKEKKKKKKEKKREEKGYVQTNKGLFNQDEWKYKSK